jgi:hypothetical protein
MICCRYFKVSKGVWCRYFVLSKLSFGVAILANFGLATNCFGNFLINLVNFLKSSGHPVADLKISNHAVVTNFKKILQIIKTIYLEPEL